MSAVNDDDGEDRDEAAERELSLQEHYKRYCYAVERAGRDQTPKSYAALGKTCNEYLAALRRERGS